MIISGTIGGGSEYLFSLGMNNLCQQSKTGIV